MITIHGRARNQGIAIAVAAVVDARTGINGVYQSILQQGIDALKKQLEMKDYPEVIIACDDLTTGLAIRIPGTRTIGIAAQSDIDLPGLEIEVPCAVGLDNLLTSISEGDILILDGNKGTAYIDPTPPTLVHYQQVEEHHEARSKIFISSEHIPARTQTGETINVFGHVINEQDMVKSLNEGADGLLMDLREADEDSQCFYERVYIQAAGKPVWFGVNYLSAELARATAKHALPEQTTVLFPVEDYDSLIDEAETVLENVGLESFLSDLEPPRMKLGLIMDEDGYSNSGRMNDDSPLVLDIRGTAYVNNEELAEMLPKWLGPRPAESVIFVIGDYVDSIPKLVEAGARSIAVTPDNISTAKYSIRSIGQSTPIDDRHFE